jgi:hypothetical protein
MREVVWFGLVERGPRAGRRPVRAAAEKWRAYRPTG